MLQPAVIKSWNALQDLLGGILKPIKNQAHYDQPAALPDDLLDEVRGNKKHPSKSMVEVVTRLIQDYDAQHPIALASPKEMLEHYMTQNQLNQSQLSARTGLDQSLMSKHLGANPPSIWPMPGPIQLALLCRWKPLSVEAAGQSMP